MSSSHKGTAAPRSPGDHSMSEGPPGAVTADEAFEFLTLKMPQKYATVREAFMNFDLNKDGSLDPREFRQSLEFMGLKMTGAEFRKLWRRWDTDGSGSMNFVEFNNRLGLIISPSAQGLPFRRPITPSLNPRQQAAMQRGLKKKLEDIESAFAQFDTDGSGRINQRELGLALQNVGVKLSLEALYKLIEAHKSPSNDSDELTLPEFKSMVFSVFKLQADGTEAGPDSKEVTAQDALRTIRAKLPRSREDFLKLLDAHDEERNGNVYASGLAVVLSQLGVSLSREQFAALVQKFDPHDDGLIPIADLLYNAYGSTQDEATSQTQRALAAASYGPWKTVGLRPAKDASTGLLVTRDAAAREAAGRLGVSVMETHLIRQLIGRKDALLAALREYDVDGFQRVTPGELRAVLTQLECAPTDDLIRLLGSRFSRDSTGRISFAAMLAEYGAFLDITPANLDILKLERVDAYGLYTSGASSGASVSGGAGGHASGDGDFGETGRSVGTPTGGAAAAATSGTPKQNTHAAKTAAVTARAASMRLGALNDSDMRSVATAEMDLSPVSAKMRRVLGKSWIRVVNDLKKQQLAASGGAGGAGVVSGEVFRDTMAANGVPLTSKEVRAIAHKFGPPGSAGATSSPRGKGAAPNTAAEGNIDVAAFLKATTINPPK